MKRADILNDSLSHSREKLLKSRLINSWNLPLRLRHSTYYLQALVNSPGPSCPIPEHLTTWKEYYEWKSIPLCSPAALLLHWPLTIFRTVQLATRESLLPEISNELRIHYLGPERELLRLAVFGELQALFPGVKVHIDLVGPTIPHVRNGEKIDLYTYAQCIDTGCGCQCSADSCHSSAITLRLYAGYHHCYRELLQDSSTQALLSTRAGYVLLK